VKFQGENKAYFFIFFQKSFRESNANFTDAPYIGMKILFRGRFMKENILFVKSAFDHGYTKNDIKKAIETKIYDGLLWGEDDIFAIIGFDTVANPIEVFYNIIDNDTIKVFHAMALRDKVAAQMDI
jgi:hypothetical protein